MKKLVLITMGLLAAVVVLAQPEMVKKRAYQEHGKHVRLKMEEKLNLTDEQQKNVEKLRLSHRSVTQDYQNELDIRQAELKAAVSSDPINNKKIDGLVKDINDLKGKLFAARISHKLEFRALLDDNQKVIFDDMPLVMRGKGHHRRY